MKWYGQIYLQLPAICVICGFISQGKISLWQNEHCKGHLAHDIGNVFHTSFAPFLKLVLLPAFVCFLCLASAFRLTQLKHLPLKGSRTELSAKTLLELWDHLLPRLLCQLLCLLPAINFTGSTGQTIGQKSGKQLTVRAAPTQHALSEGTLRTWSFWVAGPAWPNLWIFDHSPGSLIFHLRLLVWPPNRGSLGRCDAALWTLNSSGAYKNSNEGKRNFIKASSEVAMSAEKKGRGCFGS